MFACENRGREISDWEYYVYAHQCDYCYYLFKEREDDDNE